MHFWCGNDQSLKAGANAGGGSGGKQKKALFAELKGLTSAAPPGKEQGVGEGDAPEEVGDIEAYRLVVKYHTSED